jgi:hypothetical protein
MFSFTRSFNTSLDDAIICKIAELLEGKVKGKDIPVTGRGGP